MAVNLTGTFHCLQAAVPDMIEAGWGRIVTISSSSAQSGTRRMSHYVASKGGVIALTKALALDLAPNGITVNTIPPGVIDTPMMRRPIESGAMASMEQVLARAPLGRGRHARRHRGRLCLLVLRRGGVHHRPADQRERRLVPVSRPSRQRARPGRGGGWRGAHHGHADDEEARGDGGGRGARARPGAPAAGRHVAAGLHGGARGERGPGVPRAAHRRRHAGRLLQAARRRREGRAGRTAADLQRHARPGEERHGRVPAGDGLLAHRRRAGRRPDQGHDARART